MRRHLLALGVVCAAAATAACGSGGTSTSSASSGPTVGTAGVTLGSPAAHIAATDQLTFVASTVTVHVGQVIQWTNTGSVAHTVTFDGHWGQTSGVPMEPYLTVPTLAPGATWEVKFTQAGTYPYRCTIHQGMQGTIIVK